jgi:hypothetical protein
MDSRPISWYSITTDLNVQENGVVDLEGAFKVVDSYMGKTLLPVYKVEPSISNSMFGFSRSNSEFIEICVYNPTNISYKFEYANPSYSWFKRFFMGAFQYEEDLKSEKELVQKVREFFETPPQEIQARLEDE